MPELPSRGRVPMLRRLAREWAMHNLYQRDLQPAVAPADLSDIYGWAAETCGYQLTDEDTATICERADSLVNGVTRNRVEIDRLLTAAAEHWTLKRMAVIDRNIMRVAAYEMLFDPEIPTPVAIDEALDIAKEYGDEGSSKFINGVLDRINREHRPASDEVS